MPVSSYSGIETVEGRHRDAKFNIEQIVTVLLQENVIKSETYEMIMKQVSRIEDDALSVISSYTGKTFEYEIGTGKNKKQFTGEVKVEEKVLS